MPGIVVNLSVDEHQRARSAAWLSARSLRGLARKAVLREIARCERGRQSTGTPAPANMPQVGADAVVALTQTGWDRGKSDRIVRALLLEYPDATAEELIREAFKKEGA